MTNDRPPTGQQEQPTPPAMSEIEKKLLSAAEELGTWLGTAERQATAFYNQQQPAITTHLEKIRDTAVRLLAQIEKGRERSR
jgi:hypothetical protein